MTGKSHIVSNWLQSESRSTSACGLYGDAGEVINITPRRITCEICRQSSEYKAALIRFYLVFKRNHTKYIVAWYGP